jgi:membrane-bound lytic murein transglycosylase B
VATAKNAALCRAYLAEHAEIFALAEKTFGVPKNIGVALLFVETRLGEFLGARPAAHNLAAKAAANAPDLVPDYIAKLPGLNPERRAWIAKIMTERSNWAYGELKALFRYAKSLDKDLNDIPGSIFGAIGICQFIPSNVERFAVDGNGDGVIDLFNVDDAVMSMANFLSRHGWKKGKMTTEEKRAVLMRYNRSTRYVNTILALADLIGQK